MSNHLKNHSLESNYLSQVAINSNTDRPSNQYSIETPSSESASTQPIQILTHSALWLVLPIICVVIWAIFLSLASEAWKVVKSDVKPLKYSDQIPCRSCSFFSRNFYLKCAVRPLDALTDRAIDCSDYCPKKSTQVSHRFFEDDMD